MKQKVGKCVDCPPDAPDKPITAGRCNRHYWPYRASVSAKKQSAKDKVQDKKELNVFFASQALVFPNHCENCGSPLYAPTAFARRKSTCHILPKTPHGGFPVVATHLENKLFMCCDDGCYGHGKWDNGDASDRKKMPVYQTAIDRFHSLKSLLNQSELQKAKKYLGIE